MLLFLRCYAFFAPKYRKRIEAQFSPPSPQWKTDLKPNVPVFWVHALSVGEVTASIPLVKGLWTRWPHAKILVSASTQTGMETWKTWLDGFSRKKDVTHEICVIHAPFDFPCIIRRFRRRYAPHLMIFVETDIWPNWIWDFRDNGIPSILVNGSISSRSAARLRYFKPVVKLLYGGLEAISMQSEDDRMRLVALGLPKDRVLCLGNLKQAIQINTLTDSQRAELRRKFGIENERLWVAGSTHAPEEEVCFRVHAKLIDAMKALKQAGSVQGCLWSEAAKEGCRRQIYLQEVGYLPHETNTPTPPPPHGTDISRSSVPSPELYTNSLQNRSPHAPHEAPLSMLAHSNPSILQDISNPLSGLKLILAPRDVKRAPEIVELARQAGLTPCLRSNYRAGTPYDVLILDTLGELATIYALADVAFVGGSIAPVGGHNLLEPAVHGVPVLFGRHVESCAEIAKRLFKAGGGFECDEDSIEEVLFQLLTDEDMRKKAGEGAKNAAIVDGDIVNRHIELIEAVMNHACVH